MILHLGCTPLLILYYEVTEHMSRFWLKCAFCNFNPFMLWFLYNSSLWHGVCMKTDVLTVKAEYFSTIGQLYVSIPGVARGQPNWLLPSWALHVIYPVVGALLAACLAVVILYGSLWPRNVVLLWLISTFSAFLTSALLLEPLKVSSRVFIWNWLSNLKLDSGKGYVLAPY